MEKLFLTVLNMSLTGAFVIAVICLARLALKKAPKIISYALWGVAGFRLAFPFSIQGMFSLLPFNSAPIPQDIAMQAVPRIHSGITSLDNSVSAALPVATPAASMNPLQGAITIGSCIWLLGIAVMLLYGFVSVLLLKHSLRDSVLDGDNLYVSENLKTPFVIGFFKPKIYLPTGLSGAERRYIVLHEKTHIRRHDHAVKMFAYLVLCLHWFNPLAWVAFVLMGADMEMSCDECVMKELGEDIKTAYSLSLVRLAAGHKILNGSPLAFGEGGMKKRIKNVLNFKKRSRGIMVAAVALAAMLIVGFSVNRTVKDSPEASALVPASGTYYLENPTEKQRFERLASVTLYDDGRVWLRTPPISSYALPDCTLSITNDELSIHADIATEAEEEFFGVKNGEVIARFTIAEDKTVIFQWAAVPLFADVGARYVFMPDSPSVATYEQRLLTLNDVREITQKYGPNLTMEDLRGYAGTEGASGGTYVIQYFVDDGPYLLIVASLDRQTVLYTNFTYAADGGGSQSIDIRYYDVDKFIADGTKELVRELPSDLIDLPDFKPENPTGIYGGETDGKTYGGIINTAILNQYGDAKKGFLIYAPTIHGVYEEEGKLRAFVTVHYEHYRLKGKILTGQTGSVIPAAITFKREDRTGGWVMEEYTEIGSSPDFPDGAYFGDSIRKLCVLPVSGEEIKGLAQRILDDYGDHTSRKELLRESLIEHLLQYGQADVFLQNPDGNLEKLT